MRSTQARVALIVGTIAAIVILFIVLSGGDDNNSSKTTSTGATTTTGGSSSKTGTPPAPPAAVIRVVNGKPEGGIKKLSYNKGDRVRLVVRSDVADEIHVHGYNFKKDVPAGGSARFDFPAKIDGVFEIELEGRKQQIAELRVSP